MNANQQPDTAEQTTDVIRQRIIVPFEYPVHFTRGLFAADNSLLADVLDRLDEKRRHRAIAYIDSGVAEAHADISERIVEYFSTWSETMELVRCETLPGGEATKTGWTAVREVMWALGHEHLDRQSFVIAVGGGAMLDMVGFAASIVHRGVRLVRVPTTTLSQNDGGVGVKNGMDEHGQKNFVGTFVPPFAVLNDFDFLPTLSDRDWIGGAAEAFKVAIIKDAVFFDELCDGAAALRGRDMGAMERLIRRCAALHLEHIAESGDPFEFGSARPLDFGHWAAHRLETLSGYTIGHGQAVAVGMAVDSYIARQRGLITSNELDRILSGLTACGLPVWTPLLDQCDAVGVLEILVGLEQFREHLGGRLTVTLPDGIGRKTEVHDIVPAMVTGAVDYLKKVSS